MLQAGETNEKQQLVIYLCAIEQLVGFQDETGHPCKYVFI